jgi:tetratricopeptide (TPR) repeat protein
MVRSSLLFLALSLLSFPAWAGTLVVQNDPLKLELELEKPGWAATWQEGELWLLTNDKNLQVTSSLTVRALPIKEVAGVALPLKQQPLKVVGKGRKVQLVPGKQTPSQNVLLLKDELVLGTKGTNWLSLKDGGKSYTIAMGVAAPLAYAHDKIGEILNSVYGVWFIPEAAVTVANEKAQRVALKGASLPQLTGLGSPVGNMVSADLLAEDSQAQSAQANLPFNPEDVTVPNTQGDKPEIGLKIATDVSATENVRTQFSQTMDRLIDAIFAVEDIRTPGEEAEESIDWQIAEVKETAKALDLDMPESAMKEGEEKPAEAASLTTVAEPVMPEVAANVARFLVDPEEENFPEFYRDQERFYLDKLRDVTPSMRFAARRELAEFYLRESRAAEAAGVMQSRNDITPDGTLVKGVALALQGQGEVAEQTFNQIKDWPEDLVPHVELWKAYSFAKQGKTDEAAKAFSKHLSPTASLYPHAIEKELYLAYGRSLEEQGSYKDLELMLKDMAGRMPNGTLPPPAVRMMASVAIAQKKFGDAESLLAQVANNTEDTPTAYQAQYDFVKYLLKRNDLSLDLAIGHLEDLRRLWRGTDLERDILNDLGHIYRDDKQFRKSLERFRSYTTYFPNAKYVLDNTAKMTRIFMAAFEPENRETLDGLGVLGMYFDFRELTAVGDSGDKLIEEIGSRLQKLGLIDQAIELYERQLATRVENKKNRALFGAILAELYPMSARVGDGFSILEETATKGLPKDLRERRAVALGNLYLFEGEWEKAKTAVEPFKGTGATRVRIEAAWGGNDLTKLALLLTEQFKGQSENKWGAQEKADALRYMYALHRLSQTPALLRFQEIHGDRLMQANMNNQLNVLLLDRFQEPLKINGDKALAKVSRVLSSYNNFVADYNTTLEMRLDELIQREKFNRMNRQPTGRRSAALN